MSVSYRKTSTLVVILRCKSRDGRRNPEIRFGDEDIGPKNPRSTFESESSEDGQEKEWWVLYGDPEYGLDLTLLRRLPGWVRDYLVRP